MGSLRVTVCSVALAAAAGVAVTLAPAAYAGDTGGVSVFPVAPAPGSDVTLRVTGCAERTAVAASAAFVTDARLTVTGRGLAGDSRVRSTLEPGTYTVTVTCGATERTGTFTVRPADGQSPPARAVSGTPGQPPAPGSAGRSSPAPGTAGQQPAPAPGAGGQSPGPEDDPRSQAPFGGEEQDGRSSAARRPGAPASPVAPVEAGGGGAADLVTAADRGAGPGTAQEVTGLLLAGVAVVAVALGGARRSRGTD
ncbi:hypothetical protein [Streptomyces djakartensis]|uniref:Sortase n=1 Tax=Streptomyces djakartensis TaxID=68193 RepID=A0ABQ2ZLC9_9ACTN|nr:hypothetical protein [Streptomyces djakartensis]GGY17260.1 hypothetical protein GCM10010384_24080 [Streptomyces djakartensis]